MAFLSSLITLIAGSGTRPRSAKASVATNSPDAPVARPTEAFSCPTPCVSGKPGNQQLAPQLSLITVERAPGSAFGQEGRRSLEATGVERAQQRPKGKCHSLTEPHPTSILTKSTVAVEMKRVKAAAADSAQQGQDGKCKPPIEPHLPCMLTKVAVAEVKERSGPEADTAQRRQEGKCKPHLAPYLTYMLTPAPVVDEAEDENRSLYAYEAEMPEEVYCDDAETSSTFTSESSCTEYD
jgi:hypothetical protein